MELGQLEHRLMACFAVLVQVAVLSPLLLGRTEPTVSITEVPCAGSGDSVKIEGIGGEVTGIESKRLADYRIVVYALSSNETWYVQPTVAHPLTSIGSADGRAKWETETHPGTRYAALLVKAKYQPLPTTDAIP